MLTSQDNRGVFFPRAGCIGIHLPIKADEREVSKLCQQPLIESARKLIASNPNAEAFIKQSELLADLLKRRERLTLEIDSLKANRRLIESKSEKTMAEDLIECDEKIREFQMEFSSIEKQIATIQPTFERYTQLVKQPIADSELQEFRSLRQILNGKLAEVFEQVEKAIAPYLAELTLYRSAVSFVDENRRTLHQCALAEVMRYLPQVPKQTPTAKAS